MSPFLLLLYASISPNTYNAADSGDATNECCMNSTNEPKKNVGQMDGEHAFPGSVADWFDSVGGHKSTLWKLHVLIVSLLLLMQSSCVLVVV